MACPVPIRIINPRYKKLAKIRGDPLESYENEIDYYLSVPCGRCFNCRKSYRSMWRYRLLLHFKYLKPLERSMSWFVTLTFEDRYLPHDRKECGVLVRRFLERVRSKYKRSFTHWIVSEFGSSTERLHLHGLFFNVPFDIRLLDNLWKYGFVSYRPLNERRISYVTNYITKLQKNDMFEDIDKRQWVFSSPGIGKAYVLDPTTQLYARQHGVCVPFGYFNNRPFALPRYYRQHLFTDDEREYMTTSYLLHQSEDVIPEPPYIIGTHEYTDYSLYKAECIRLRKLYFEKYKSLIYGKFSEQSSFETIRYRIPGDKKE